MSRSLPGTVTRLSKGYNQVWHKQLRSNQGLEPTASSVRYAPASGSGSGLAFGVGLSSMFIEEQKGRGGQ